MVSREVGLPQRTCLRIYDFINKRGNGIDSKINKSVSFVMSRYKCPMPGSEGINQLHLYFSYRYYMAAFGGRKGKGEMM